MKNPFEGIGERSRRALIAGAAFFLAFVTALVQVPSFVTASAAQWLNQTPPPRAGRASGTMALRK